MSLKPLTASEKVDRDWRDDWQTFTGSPYDPARWQEFIHPNDRYHVGVEIKRGRETGKFCAEYRILTPKGYKWVRAFADVLPTGRSWGYVMEIDSDRKHKCMGPTCFCAFSVPYP